MQLLYPGQHSFDIINEMDIFEVLIHIPIHRYSDSPQLSNNRYDNNTLIPVYGNR